MLDSGQMRQTIVGGIPYCVIRKLTVGTEKGTEKSAKVQQARMG